MFDKLINERNALKDEISSLKNEIEKLTENKNNLITEITDYNNRKNNLDIQIKVRENFYVETELKYIDYMEGLSFEKYAGELLESIGYSSVVTKSSNDFGGDIIAEKDGIKYAIQCKRYSDKLSAKPLGEALRAKGNYHCDKAVVLTNNYYTPAAVEEATNCDIVLWDRNDLTQMLYKKFEFDIKHFDEKKIKKLQKEDSNFDDETDPFLMDAIDIVVKTGQASTSFIQHRFKVGYARAGRIMDQMEQRGIITGYQGSNPREVLMSKERWEELKTMPKE